MKITSKNKYSLCLDSRFINHVCVLFFFFFFFFFFFLFSRVFGGVRLLFNEQQLQMLTFFSEQCIRALFMDPQISFFINFFIKNGSHGTIYTFKNYFSTVILAISFQFQQNKSYPNRPIKTKHLFDLITISLSAHTSNSNTYNHTNEIDIH